MEINKSQKEVIKKRIARISEDITCLIDRIRLNKEEIIRDEKEIYIKRNCILNLEEGI